MSLKKIIIIDFGSQFTQLIARRVRELGVYSEILSHKKKINFNDNNVSGIILSGGPLNVYQTSKVKFDKKILNQKIPILGICFGHQIISKELGGKVKKSKHREFGLVKIKKKRDSTLTINFFNKKGTNNVWMSHSDQVTKLPKNFQMVASSDNAKFCIIQNKIKNFYGIQFHPEVTHTKNGTILLKNFLFSICKSKKNWSPKKQKEQIIENIKKQVGNSKVICALSGGVDSSVVALLIHKAIKKNLICIMVDTGLMRKNEFKKTYKIFKKKYKLNVKLINASKLYYSKLKNISDPEKKRKLIGKLFINIFEKEAKKNKKIKFLAQGTLYPDIIESRSTTGKSTKIKSHHNVGGLPKKMRLKLIEPLRDFFKDEVRSLGKSLGLTDKINNRHPFPGPGLAIRILGKVTPDKIRILQDADHIFINELINKKLYNKIWQAYAALLPVKTVGVMGDTRTYEHICLLRAVISEDGMSADYFKFPQWFLDNISNKIINNVPGINRVVYDITSKPPSTIELE